MLYTLVTGVLGIVIGRQSWMMFCSAGNEDRVGLSMVCVCVCVGWCWLWRTRPSKEHGPPCRTICLSGRCTCRPSSWLHRTDTRRDKSILREGLKATFTKELKPGVASPGCHEIEEGENRRNVSTRSLYQKGNGMQKVRFDRLKYIHGVDR